MECVRRGDEGEAAWEGHHRLQLRDCSAGWPSCSGDELLLGVADQLVLQQAFLQLQQVQEACASALQDASIISLLSRGRQLAGCLAPQLPS